MKKCVLILYGGKSVEHEISIRSAVNVHSNLNEDLFDKISVGISKSGEWFLTTDIIENIESGIPVAPVPSKEGPFLMEISSRNSHSFDIVFPVLHGTDGEDGSVQGIFKSYNVPLVGCSVLGSAVAMDKIVSKQLLEISGVGVADYLFFNKSEKRKTFL